MSTSGKILSGEVPGYEDVIKRINSVMACRVVLDKEGSIAEIHILADTERNPKQIVRDIESALMVKFDVVLDHKKVSIVQMREENGEVKEEKWRPQLININTEITGLKVQVSVKIAVGDDIVEGTAGGPYSTSNRLRVMVDAVLNGLECLFIDRVTFVVDDIAQMNFGRQKVILVSVTLVTAHGEEILLGSAFVKGDENKAAARATLDAVTRKLAFYNHGLKNNL